MSLTEMWCMYSRETGLPPTGPAYRLVSHVISRFSVPCPLCNRAGSKALNSTETHCIGCAGFRSYLSPVAIRRAHQIVRAAFPSVGTAQRADESARRWARREYHPAVGPVYLGRDALPMSVPRTPPEYALSVASITWRRGLRSDLLWAMCDPGVHVLWERLPDQTLPGGEPWTEVFAWACGDGDDPRRRAQRLIQLGWAEMNPAYGWLARCRSSGPLSAFSVTSPGLLAADEIEWLFRLAARARYENAKRRTAVSVTKRPAPSGSQNIGPYPFGVRPRHPGRPHVPSDSPEAP